MNGDVNAFMNGYTPNRQMPDGPNRETFQKILKNDRLIVAHIVTSSAVNVLEKHYGFSESKTKEFQDLLQEEIQKS